MVHPTHARVQVINDLRNVYLGAGGSIKVALYKDALTPDESTPLATFLANECAFPGYARIDSALSAASASAAGDGHSYTGLSTWTRSSGGSGDSVGGIMVLCIDSGSVVKMVYVFKDFETPVPMTVAGQTLSRLIEVLQGQYPIA